MPGLSKDGKRLPTTRAALTEIQKAPIPGDWAEHAACRGMAPTDGVSPNPFFPERGGSLRQARGVCAGCVVQAYCRTYALRHPVLGIWGGMDERSRKLRRRARRKVS